MTIQELTEGQHIQNAVFLLRKVMQGTTKAGKPYFTYQLQDSSGSIDGKVWTPDRPEFEEVSEGDFVVVSGEVTSFNGQLQLRLDQVGTAEPGTYDPKKFFPASDKDPEEMYKEILRLVESVKTDYMHALLVSFFGDEDFKKRFLFHSAAKSVHHGFIGGLCEHTLSVAQNCNFIAKHYEFLDRDLLVTAALLHDIGKLDEIAPFPQNDYTDDGQLLGHIVIGTEMIRDRIREEGIRFPEVKERELLHCILAHHGELEFGSPKKPAIAEALALSFADNLDAKMETFREAVSSIAPGSTEWKGYNRFLETNIRRTAPEE